MKFSFRTYLMNDLFFLVSPTGWKDRELFYTDIGGSSTKILLKTNIFQEL